MRAASGEALALMCGRRTERYTGAAALAKREYSWSTAGHGHG
jgi:hypothetical protein